MDDPCMVVNSYGGIHRYLERYIEEMLGSAEYLSWLTEEERLLLTNPGELEYRSWLK